MKANVLSLGVLSVLTAAFFAAAALGGGGVEVDPESVELILNPGDVQTIQCDVIIPCDTAPPKVDVYLLADTTGSMGAILQAVQDAGDEIVDTLLATPNVDLQIGVGNYKDFNDSDPYAFQHQQNPTSVAQDIKDAFNDWSAAGGSDPPEAQLYALSKIATDPAIGFRTGTDVKRIIVWFGDRPGHDPICQNIHNDGMFPFDITEATTTAALQAAGEGGTAVTAISTRIGKPGALDADPDPFSVDYENCDPDGAAGQATRITAATGGDHILVLNEPGEIVDEILDAVETIIERVDVEMEAAGDIIPFVTDIDPEIYEQVEVPLCEISPNLVLPFEVTFEGQPCIENESHFFGGLHILVNNQIVEVKNVTIIQEECVESVCLMVMGAQKQEVQIGDDPNDILLLRPKRPKRDWMWPVTMESIPLISVPDDPKLEGKHIYLQVIMQNRFDFPGDPLQLSNGLDIEIGSDALPTTYGPSTTIDVWGNDPVPVGGVIDFSFAIDGF